MRRDATRRLPDPVIGLITIVVVGVASALIFFGLPFRGGYEVKAVLRGAPEVQPGSKVRIAGVNAGKVTGSERGPGNLTTITLQLEDSALPLHRDATLKLRPRTFLEGGLFVDLKPGTPTEPELQEGDTIPVASTSVAVLLGHATADLRAATRDNLRHLVGAFREALEGEGVESLHDAQRHIAPAFRGLAQLAEASRGQEEGDLSGAVRATGRTAEAVASRDRQLADLLTGLNRTARALGSRREQLGSSLSELDGLLAEARPALSELNDLFPRARTFAAELRPSIRAAPESLRLALPFLDQAQALLRRRELPALLAQADPAIRSLARLEPPLARLLRLVTPVTECLHRNAYPVLTSRIEDPPHTTGDPLYRELVHGLPGLAGVAQNFDGNGQTVRYHAGIGERTVSLTRPGGDEIVGLTPEPILGSRPMFRDQLPPFRPDVPCTTQDPPNLRAETAPPPAQSRVSRAALRRGLRRSAEAFQRGRR
jgi:phospholipid/cholesterol/gamma-HCH transport system substrate-binding protein